MAKEIDLRLVTLKGFTRADQVTAENIEMFAASLNGTAEEGELTFQIHNWVHHAGIGDWIVAFFPHGDLQVYSDLMFNRIFEFPEEV